MLLRVMWSSSADCFPVMVRPSVLKHHKLRSVGYQNCGIKNPRQVYYLSSLTKSVYHLLLHSKLSTEIKPES